MSNYQVFTPEEAARIEVLFDAILPALDDVKNPGAKKAGVVHFLDTLLSKNDLYYEIPTWIELYKKAAEDLNTVSQTLFLLPLAEITREQATELLSRLQSGTLDDLVGDIGHQKRLFTTLWRHCIQGAFADPKWGGNREKVMWRWYGYLQEPQQIIDYNEN